MKYISGLVIVLVAGVLPLLAHCEIPCGIYDDQLRLQLIQEHITTIEKSMKQIESLQTDPAKNANQLIRWVQNKEEHALKIQEIVTQYFMTQRIKLDAHDYDQKMRSLHELLVYSMKCKQTLDHQYIEKLKSSLERFKNLYLTHKHK